MLFEGDSPKDILSTSRFSEFLEAKKIEFPNVTVKGSRIVANQMDFRRLSHLAKHCGSSRSVLREDLSISTSLLSSCKPFL